MEELNIGKIFKNLIHKIVGDVQCTTSNFEKDTFFLFTQVEKKLCDLFWAFHKFNTKDLLFPWLFISILLYTKLWYFYSF